MMEQQFQFFENTLALLEGIINTLENEKVSLLGKVN
jgi:exonuclease VII small subunit